MESVGSQYHYHHPQRDGLTIISIVVVSGRRRQILSCLVVNE